MQQESNLKERLAMKLRPYIGITDFTTEVQVEQMLKVFHENTSSENIYLLHVGVMMSYKTLNGIPTQWQNAFPPKESIARIFNPDRPDLYFCLHYADYTGHTQINDLVRALGFGGLWINAIQLDMPWPDPAMIAEAIHRSRKAIEVILQIGPVAFQAARNDPEIVLERLERYKGIIHRVLLDNSAGRGVELDDKFLLPFARAIRKRCSDLSLGIAGGLGPNKLHLAAPFLKEFPATSIDAQSQLRPSGSAMDPIDWDLAATYLKQALAACS